MRLRKKSMVTAGVRFNIEFSEGRLDLIFDADADRGDSRVFGRPFRESGLLRFRRSEAGSISVFLLFAPFDMFSQSDAEIQRMITEVEAVPIEGFVVQARSDNLLRETRAIIAPKAVSEEGVEFEFQEAERRWIGGAMSKVTAEEILADIFVSERLAVSLFNGEGTLVRTYATIEFDHMDDYRSAVASAFGNDYAATLAARHGYEIDE